MIKIIDSHCHLYYEPYISNLNKIIQDCREEDVLLMLTIGVDYETSLKNIEISKNHDEIYCTVGLHPNNVIKKKDDIEKILSLTNDNNKIIGLGESGIDLYRSKDNLDDQINIFEKHIEKSIEKKLPLIIHTRNSDTETLNVLTKYKNKKLKFLVHCFSSDYNFAKKILDLDGFISFGGMLTFKNNEKLRQVCAKIPIDKILVETDSPYLSPHPFRGKTNHPKNTKLVINELACLKKITLEDASIQTSHNFKKLFAI
jgi:TatD DNase family protein